MNTRTKIDEKIAGSVNLNTVESNINKYCHLMMNRIYI